MSSIRSINSVPRRLPEASPLGKMHALYEDKFAERVGQVEAEKAAWLSAAEQRIADLRESHAGEIAARAKALAEASDELANARSQIGALYCIIGVAAVICAYLLHLYLNMKEICKL